VDQAAERALVLVVDDDDDIREAVVEILRLKGYRVAGAVDGTDALARLRAGVRPSLILLDLMMPRMDGWQFRGEQSRDPALAGIPVVVFSGDGLLDESLAELVPAAWLRKPLELGELLATVARFCDGGATVRQPTDLTSAD
jgi:CheY-like chemotaxis protein